MPSNKFYKYMKQYEERNYAPKARKLEKKNKFQHSNGSEGRPSCEASSCDSLLCSRQEQEEIKGDNMFTAGERYSSYKRCPCARCDKEANEILEDYEKNNKIYERVEELLNVQSETREVSEDPISRNEKVKPKKDRKNSHRSKKTN